MAERQRLPEARQRLREFDLGPHLHRVACPTFISHGTADPVVNSRAADKTFAGLGTADKVLRWWTEAETGSLHSNTDNPTEAYPTIIDWVVERLRGLARDMHPSS